MRKELGALILAGATIAGCGPSSVQREATSEPSCSPTIVETEYGEEICITPGQSVVLAAEKFPDVQAIVSNQGDLDGNLWSDDNLDFKIAGESDVPIPEYLFPFGIITFIDGRDKSNITVRYSTSRSPINPNSTKWNFVEVR